jgi:hypothetical protein
MSTQDSKYLYRSSFRSQAAFILLLSFLLGPLAVSAQCDHILGEHIQAAKILDHDAIDSILLTNFCIDLSPSFNFQLPAPPQIKFLHGMQTLIPCSSRAPPEIQL